MLKHECLLVLSSLLAIPLSASHCRGSAGHVYVKFEAVAGASAARVALHNRYFAGKPISATFLVRLQIQGCFQVAFLQPEWFTCRFGISALGAMLSQSCVTLQ